jgi:NAD(P)-dependent dehydrogenase (short-subunit alcohol dehydrogenase family)
MTNIKTKFEKYSLEKDTALITGGAGLLGVQHAAAILEAGGSVVLTDLRTEELKRAKEKLSEDYAEKNIYIYEMNVTERQHIKSVDAELKSKGIHVSILINNAAIDPKVNEQSTTTESSRLENFDLDQWNLQLSVGLTGAFLCSQTFGTTMAKSDRSGVILNISSDLSQIAPDQRLYTRDGVDFDLQPVKPVTYSVIKSGLIGLTKYLATYWCDAGIRCNALSPGGVYLNQGQNFVNKIERLIPMGRMASADEYRSTVQYMCSEASSYMNGQNIIVDGGRSVW